MAIVGSYRLPPVASFAPSGVWLSGGKMSQGLEYGLGMVSWFCHEFDAYSRCLHWGGVSPPVFLGIESLTSAIAGVPVAFRSYYCRDLSEARDRTWTISQILSEEIRIPDGETIHDYHERLD